MGSADRLSREREGRHPKTTNQEPTPRKLMTHTTAKTALAAIVLFACLSAVGWQFREHPAIESHMQKLELQHGY